MVKIVYEPHKDRAAAYDDAKYIGESTYSKADDLWIINHTFVTSDYSGQGIATRLVEKLVDEARENNIKIIPLCPFAKREFEKKEQYLDVLSK